MERTWGYTVRISYFSLPILFLLLPVLGCGKKLPDAYGIYADTNHGLILLQGQGVHAAGNLMSYYSGLPGPSGTACDSLNGFIVYEKDIDPNSIGLVKLQFLREGNISSLMGFGATRVEVNLWVPIKDHIDLAVEPVERRRDMYLVSPRATLEKGFYALYIGQFGAEIGSERHVYDVVVGSAGDFPSYASALATLQDEVKKNAPALLDRMNQMLNRGDYAHLGDVYRPGGKVLSGAELQAFSEGNKTWLLDSGRILKSEIISVTPLDEDGARCAVRTSYEKAGVQEESVIVRKIAGQWFITDLK
ncbi:MAG: hypothetical protein ACLQG3_06400 [Terracidiphilus sp.]